MIRIFFSIMSLLLVISAAHADEYRPAYLEFTQTNESTFDMLWKVPAKGQRQRLSLFVLLPTDVITVSKPRSTFMGGAHIQRSTISRIGGIAGVEISIKGLERVSTDVLVRIQRLNGTSETARLNASATTFVVKGTPQFWDVVNTYVVFGIEHILNGFDHLLFVACLIFIAGTWRRILLTITGFTVAHSITLTLAALGMVRLPIPPIEAVIALSITFLAREIMLEKRDTLSWKYPVVISSSFGLLHGFGFASALSDIGLPQTEIPAALLAFNVGVEIGQLLFVIVLFSVSTIIIKISNNVQTLSKPLLISMQKPIALFAGVISMFWVIERINGF